MSKTHQTPTGHILYIEVGSTLSAGAWSVNEEREGARVLIGNGAATTGDPAGAEAAARAFCRRYDATEAIVMDSLARMVRSNGHLTDGALRKRFAPLLARFS